LLDLRAGRPDAADALAPLVYEELLQIARRHLRGESVGHTLCTGALANEAWLRLADQQRVDWTGRAHFFAVASQMMRRILVDHARRARAGKRGGAWQRVDLDAAEIPIAQQAESLVALDEALTRLTSVAPRLAQVVECRFFGGMTEEETAAALGVTDRTVRRDWIKARGWLAEALRGEGEATP
jgi:RNA polymerase sigma factor (TIGR02999 family)